jgi:magnesium-transporting ATPase (P-type)
LRKPEVQAFFKFNSVCHTVFVIPNPDDPNDPLYQASSPDELALVKGAARLGYRFSDMSNDYIHTEFPGEDRISWEIVCEIPFSSTRKRMSLVVRDPYTKKLLLMTKGADSIMMPLLLTPRPETQSHLDAFAREGLRTLVMCQRYVDEDEFNSWYAVWQHLQLSTRVDKETRLDDHGDKIEHGYELIGASAIEDKLQDGVPDTIALLLRANIRVWMLTGDKQETAIEIGRSCSLVKTEMELIDLSSFTLQEFEQKLVHATSKLDIYDEDMD